MATLEAVKWAGSLRDKLFSLRQMCRATAAQIQTLQGQVNAMTTAQKNAVGQALTAMGLDIASMQSELAAMVTLSNTIMSTVGDGSEPV